ncbi:citrate synthase [Halohasta litorea]|uniref:Citrate synthase n=1 Tax=Halohasta litorea TaxID=869891 RepID=A0ABD6D9J3_9EURY|nr:citrate synthase [Halohasta litorea]
MTTEYNPGLDGIVLGPTELSGVDGAVGQLTYRGYPIEELAGTVSYEETVYLLWNGELPTAAELDAFTDRLAANRALPEPLPTLLASLVDQDDDPMDALRTAISALTASDPASDEATESREDAEGAAIRLVAVVPTIIATFVRLRDGNEPIEPRADLGHAANFLYMLTGEEPDPVVADTLDTALVLHLDHGINASTFSGKVNASTLATVYGSVTGSLAALSGPLHGGANADVMRMLQKVDASDKSPTEWIDDAIDRGDRIPGFGHRVYQVKDPRAVVLQERSKALAEAAGETKWYAYSTEIEQHLAETKGIQPNVDFYSSSMYYVMDIPIDIYTPIFAISRMAGWLAHLFEQYENNRLIRPLGDYVGDHDKTVTPLDER